MDKTLTCVYCSWMGRTVVDFPLGEIASFIADPDSAPLYDKYIIVSLSSKLGVGVIAAF